MLDVEQESKAIVAFVVKKAAERNEPAEQSQILMSVICSLVATVSIGSPDLAARALIWDALAHAMNETNVIKQHMGEVERHDLRNPNH